MRKIYDLAIIIISIEILLSGCTTNSLAPQTIQYNNNNISYSMNQSDIQKYIGNGDSLSNNQIEYDNSIIINYNNKKIRCITITNHNIVTFNNIKVDDNVFDVLSKYKYEQKIGNNYMVTFQNNNEVDPTTSEKNFWIIYEINNNKISKITMYDNTYAKTME